MNKIERRKVADKVRMERILRAEAAIIAKNTDLRTGHRYGCSCKGCK